MCAAYGLSFWIARNRWPASARTAAIEGQSQTSVVIDAEGLVAYANPALLQQLALRLEDLVGSDAVRLHPALASLACVRQREEREIGHAGVRYQLIANAITAHGGSLRPVYEQLGISRKTLYEKMQKHGLDKSLAFDSRD